MWKKENKNLPWELGNSEEYTHNLEKKEQGSTSSLEFCLFVFTNTKRKSSPQQKKKTTLAAA